jgi:hypothetical protein
VKPRCVAACSVFAPPYRAEEAAYVDRYSVRISHCDHHRFLRFPKPC